MTGRRFDDLAGDIVFDTHAPNIVGSRTGGDSPIESLFGFWHTRDELTEAALGLASAQFGSSAPSSVLYYQSAARIIGCGNIQVSCE